jgi:hypothetical protein
MAVSLARVAGADCAVSNKRYRIRDVTFDNSYVQTGEPVNASDFGLRKFDSLEPLGNLIPSAGTTAWSVTAQISSSGTSAVLFVHGQEPTSATATTIAFADADSTEDLSTFSVRMRAIGV